MKIDFYALKVTTPIATIPSLRKQHEPSIDNKLNLKRIP